MDDYKKAERFEADDVNELIWLRIKRLKNTKLCENLLKQKKFSNHSSINDKALGLSSAIKSCLGFWEQNISNLNTWVLSRYYALFQMTIAEQVASDENMSSLSDIQKSTIYGHGLKIYWNENNSIDKLYIYISNSGYFPSYLKYKGFNARDYFVDENIKKENQYEKNQNKLVSLFDVWRRIPELREITQEYLNLPSYSFHIGYSDQNLPFEKAELNKKTFIDIWEPQHTLEELKNLKLPLYNLKEYQSSIDKSSIIYGEVNNKSKNWKLELHTYESSYAPSSIIIPLFDDINDVICLHFMILYALSIIVRYYPSLWYEIEEGQYSHIGALIEHYLSVFDKTIPLIMLEKISGNKIYIARPGEFGARI